MRATVGCEKTVRASVGLKGRWGKVKVPKMPMLAAMVLAEPV